jgi:hypothetical protein
MATRALIGYLNDDRVITTTYNHYDGYPEYLGKKLKEFYNTDSLAKKISNTGYISSIEEDGSITSKFNEIADKIQLDDDVVEAGLTVAQEINGVTGEYGYIWIGYDWFTIKNNGIEGMAAQFDNIVSQSTLSGMFIVDESKTTEENIMKEGYEAKWAKFLNEAQEMDFDVIKRFIQDDTQRGDEEDPAMDAYIASLKRDFEAGGERSSVYDDYEMDDYVEDFENYIADKMDS